MEHRFCQWNQGLFMALAACLVLSLLPGAEALTCRKCQAKNDRKCRSHPRTCEETRENAVCMIGRKYTDEKLIQTFMRCALDNLHCGVEATVPVDNFRMEIECCSDRDFCSDDM